MTTFRRVTLACAAFVLIGASAVSARELVLAIPVNLRLRSPALDFSLPTRSKNFPAEI